MGLKKALWFAAEPFPSAEELLKSRRRQSTACLIADVQVPDMTGLEYCRRLVASGYLTKPFLGRSSEFPRLASIEQRAGAFPRRPQLPHRFNPLRVLQRIGYYLLNISRMFGGSAQPLGPGQDGTFLALNSSMISAHTPLDPVARARRPRLYAWHGGIYEPSPPSLGSDVHF